VNSLSVQFIVTIIITLSLLVYWVFNFIILYHLTRFGVGTLPKRGAIIFLLGAIALSFISFLFFVNIDVSILKQQLDRFGQKTFSAPYQK